MSAVALLLRKDLTVLRRSPLLLGALLAYPVVIALLVGLVAGYASAKPRVAYVDEDDVPPVVAGRGTQLPRAVDHRRGLAEGDARHERRRGRRELASGKVVATITVPPGFVGALETTAESPSLVLRPAPAASRRASRSRCRRSSTG